MRLLLRDTVALLAIWLVALHTVLWTPVMGFTASPATDLFTVICHSQPGTTDDPANAPPTPTHVCDHCYLCTVAGATLAPDTAFRVHFDRVRTLQLLRPLTIARHVDATADPKLARGPPTFA
jgi:hypothetical protein